ncbi:MAG: hypothetical protein HOP30_11025 [Cyclobacteriaceae bacterium]|nr:hypothetical protein [Cyclobacteriaceae bacterium]
MIKVSIIAIFISICSPAKEALEFLKIGINALNSGQYYEAVAYLDSAITLNPRLVKAYVFRGKAKSEIAMMELAYFDRTLKFEIFCKEALQDFNKSLELDPNDAQSYFERGKLRGVLYDKVGRLNDFNNAIKINPKYSEAFAQRCAAYRFDANYVLALSDINQAIKLEPDQGWFYHIRGELNIEMEQKEAACNDWSLAIERGFTDSQKLLKKHCN